MILQISVTIAVAIVTIFFLYRRRKSVRPLRDMYIVITGCDTGFGRIAALRFDALGMHVFAGCLQGSSIKELKEKCSNRLTPIILDVTKQDHIQNLTSVVKENLPEGKGLNGVINNAGISGIAGLVESLSSEQYMGVFKVNFFGMIDVTKALMTHLRKGRGRIINTASVAGKLAAGFIAPYHASKHAVESYSDSLRRELYNDDISVHVIEPAFFKTGILFGQGLDELPYKYFNDLPKETREFYGDDFMTKAIESMDAWRNGANTNVGKVVDAYQHALTSSYPKIRYKVGAEANILLFVAYYFPEWLVDMYLGHLSPVPRGKL
ncbi:hypothetical protein FSP39_004716 [Pinctada imbricata]|uniref:Uncharacterized protein n=1 Tax=Pinctada imbricata TaxID=66713 RepID=A0AA88YN16_PINIB|nr:hypothetical protein FSP39_004716 [Pinctada imbricata]